MARMVSGKYYESHYDASMLTCYSTSDWPPQSSMGDSQRRIWYTVPMDYIQNLFKMETWQRQGHLRDWTTFHIPRTGATSLYIFSFTTMSWSEEQRVINEEAAELLAIAKAQPATKKRLIASGQGKEQRRDEKTVIETVIGKDNAAKAKSRLWRPRRHSSFMLDAPPGVSQILERSRRSRSVAPEPEEILSPQNDSAQEAVTDGLLRSFLEIYDSLPSSRDSQTVAGIKATSELVKNTTKRSHRVRRTILPPLKTTYLPLNGQK